MPQNKDEAGSAAGTTTKPVTTTSSSKEVGLDFRAIKWNLCLVTFRELRNRFRNKLDGKIRRHATHGASDPSSGQSVGLLRGIFINLESSAIQSVKMVTIFLREGGLNENVMCAKII